MSLLTALDRFNAAHPWSHNDAFSGFVLRHARAVRRAGGAVAVDVGCGTGNMAELLGRVFPEVVGIEPDEKTAAAAARRFAAPSAVRIEQRPFIDEPECSYDLIVFVASLHHMPLRTALRQARTALRPAGRIVIVGLARETAADRLRSVISLALNPVVGFFKHPARAAHAPSHMRAPISPVNESFEEIRAVAHEELPGIRIRRRLFWRYTADWRASN